MSELLARRRAALRRRTPLPESPVVATADFSLDLADKTGTRTDGVEFHLTPTEWSIVEVLVRHPGRLVTQRHLLEQIWGGPTDIDTNLLRVHLTHIRRKLEPDPARPHYFITEPRLGYRFTDHANTP